MSNPIIILGSSRSFGNTRDSIEMIINGHSQVPLMDLNTLNISPYDYEAHNKADDYLPLMERITDHDLIILATPVYWYTMSAQMKIFIDRLSDLLYLRKDIGRKLRQKRLFVIASFSTSLPNGFEEPFSQTCNYMGMHYEGCSYMYHGDDSNLLAKNNAAIAHARRIIFGE